MENKTKIMQHVLKMQSISLLPICIKSVSGGDILCVHICECRSLEHQSALHLNHEQGRQN